MSSLTSVLLAGGFLALAVWEAVNPARPPTASLGLRWFGNVAVFALGWFLAALLPFLSATTVAVMARSHGLGLLNAMPFSPVFALPLSVVLLDLIAYWQHRLLHFFRPLWRLHALHHSDTDLDVATYIRHHPIEILVQVFLDASAIVAFGFSPLSVALSVTIASLVQMAAHANINLGRRFRWLSVLLVTPEFHRLHHSRRIDENNANFSEISSIWDRLFGTMRLEPCGTLELGLPEFVETKFQRLDQMLLLPLLIPTPAMVSKRAE